MNKRLFALTTGLCMTVLIFAGCKKKENTYTTTGMATGASVASSIEEKEEVSATSEPETRLILKYEGELYYNSGEECPYTGGRCGVMDGEITSTVAEGEIPKKNNQSNFGKYEFQFCEHGIDVWVDGKILQFRK